MDHAPHHLIAEQLQPLAFRVGDLTPDPKNARRHPHRNLEAIKASLQIYGQRKPLVVRRDGFVVEAGNGTLAAAKALGWTHVAAVLVDDDPLTATGYAIADNRTAELAEWDEQALSALLADLQAEDLDLDLGLLIDQHAPAPDQPDDLELAPRRAEVLNPDLALDPALSEPERGAERLLAQGLAHGVDPALDQLAVDGGDREAMGK